MRRVRYRVAPSLDGYIAGPDGEIDWIVHDPTIDRTSLFAGSDAVLLGAPHLRADATARRPYVACRLARLRVSRMLAAAEHPGVTVASANAGETVTALRSEPCRDLWLFGGGSLFASLLAAKVVDQVDVAIMPVLLGDGIPLVARVAPRSQLTLIRSDASASGIVSLRYNVQRSSVVDLTTFL